MMKRTSCSVGAGAIVMSEGLSVVPHMVMPSHGRKNSTRPSRVLGIMRPMLQAADGETEASRSNEERAEERPGCVTEARAGDRGESKRVSISAAGARLHMGVHLGKPICASCWPAVPQLLHRPLLHALVGTEVVREDNVRSCRPHNQGNGDWVVHKPNCVPEAARCVDDACTARHTSRHGRPGMSEVVIADGDA
jgi:hypothetical protein